MSKRANGPVTDGASVPPAVNATDTGPRQLIMAMSFQAVSFYDKEQKRQVIILYALGQDGIVREFNGTSWKGFPIT